MLTSLVSRTDDESPGLYGFLNVIVHSATGFKQSSSKQLGWGGRRPDTEPKGAGTREAADRREVRCWLTPTGCGVAFPGLDPAVAGAWLRPCELGSCPLQASPAIAGAGVCYRQKTLPRLLGSQEAEGQHPDPGQQRRFCRSDEPEGDPFNTSPWGHLSQPLELSEW